MGKVNLNVMTTLKQKFNKVVGFSDHTSGVIAAIAAVTLGASIVEKHITLSRAMKGTDQAGSLEETGLKKMIEYIRLVEKAKGDGIKIVDPATESAKIKLARSLTSKRDLNKGEILTEAMICLKSPGNGLLWRERELIIGKVLVKNISADCTLWPDDFKNG
jgi:sialic acid synthase SpsE